MNTELMNKCEVLENYAIFVDKIKTYRKSMPLTNAVDKAVDECVADGVLEKFLSRHRKEVRNMVLTEFDEEKFLKMVRAEERAEGRIETLMGILCDLGEIPPQIIDRAKALDAITLKEWTKLAARAENMAEFFEKIG